MLKARQITEFGEHAKGGGELHTAHGLQAKYGWIESPVDDSLS